MDEFKFGVSGLGIGFAIGVICGILSAETTIRSKAVDRGFAIYCPDDGAFAWKDECGTCGADTSVEPLNAPAICEDCCAKSEIGHEWGYVDRTDGWRCKHCDAQPPDDFYSEDYR